MKRSFHSPVCWLAIAALGMLASGATAAEAAAEAEPSRVLLVTGVDYQGHHWKKTAPPLRAALEKDPRLEVRIVDDLEFLATDVIFDYDVLFLHFKNYDQPQRFEAVRANLTRFLDEGGGIVLFHFTCGAFEQWDGFLDLAGRVWDKEKRGHDPRGPFTVHVVDREHPITNQLDDFEIDDELYTCLGGDRPIRVLATARSKVDGQDYPMAFVCEGGRGRVFHTVLGHDVKAIAAPGLGQLIQRATLWAAGQTP
jgi:type 1 glutamine amidotransferase